MSGKPKSNVLSYLGPRGRGRFGGDHDLAALHEYGGHLRGNQPRADRIDAHAHGPELERGRLDQCLEGRKPKRDSDLTGRSIMQRKVRNTLWNSAASALLIMAAGLSGCAMFSPSNVPVDCDVVKTQQKAGQSDAQIAANLNAPVDQVAACHGPETSGNKSTLIP